MRWRGKRCGWGGDAPALAILDWVMPGLEVVRRVRARPTDNPPYLLMLTSRKDKADLVAGLGAGANDYLSKPFDPGELRVRVEVGRRMVELQAELKERNAEMACLHRIFYHDIMNAGTYSIKLLTEKYLKGEVSFASAEGTGTVFTVRYPRTRPF